MRKSRRTMRRRTETYGKKTGCRKAKKNLVIKIVFRVRRTLAEETRSAEGRGRRRRSTRR